MESEHNNKGLKRIIHAFGYSMQGFKHCARYEAAFRQEVFLSFILVPAAFYYAESKIELAILLFSWFMVLIVELLNTAIEDVVDRIGPEHHPLSGRAKDVASAAVFLAIAMASMVWVIILI